jgi:D-alanyl-D-alanine carboxypeptidase
MLVPTEQYLQRLIPTDDNTVILSPGIKFNSVTTQMLSMDSQATTISVQETANGGSYSYSPAEPLTQSQLVKNVLGGESGLVLIRESAEYSKAQDAWILDYLEEPVIEDFSGDFMVFDKALLPQLASNSNLYAIDTSAQQLFEAVTSSEASGSSTIEGESYSPITNGVIGGSQGSGYDASLNFVIPLEGEGRDYAPASLSEVEGKYVDSRAAAALQQMLNDCRAAGNQVAIFRAYEEWIDPDISDSDFDSVNSSYKHVLQSGLCVLFARYENGDNYQVESMNDEIAQWDKAVTWLKEHCADYGFVQRWSWDKQDIQGISTVRPGMFRYVGVDAAKYMTANDLVLEEYVAENGGAVDKVTTPYVVSNS